MRCCRTYSSKRVGDALSLFDSKPSKGTDRSLTGRRASDETSSYLEDDLELPSLQSSLSNEIGTPELSAA
jgi:hypothetical protein